MADLTRNPLPANADYHNISPLPSNYGGGVPPHRVDVDDYDDWICGYLPGYLPGAGYRGDGHCDDTWTDGGRGYAYGAFCAEAFSRGTAT